MVIMHRMPLVEAARGYKIFNDEHEEDGTLVQEVGATLPCNINGGLIAMVYG